MHWEFVSTRLTVLLLFAASIPGLVLSPTAAAQDLEPRIFAPAPVGMNFGLLAYGYSNGNILFDPSVPLEGSQGTVHTATAGFVHTIDFFGMTAKVTAVVPFGWGDWEGDVDGEFRTTSRRGFADPMVQFGLNFIGAPATDLKGMRHYRERTIVGGGLLVVMPLGQYDPDKLINLGSNRWVFRPKIGISHRISRWVLEAMGSVRLFTDNTDPFGSEVLSQDPLWALSVDAIYTVKPGLWVGVGAGMGRGGRTTVDGVPKDTYQRNGRLAAVLVYPLSRLHSLKLTWVDSVRTDRGTDFNLISLAFQMRWGGGL